MTLDLSDEESVVLLGELDHIVGGDRRPARGISAGKVLGEPGGGNRQCATGCITTGL
jgi:hypothetical protein